MNITRRKKEKKWFMLDFESLCTIKKKIHFKVFLKTQISKVSKKEEADEPSQRK
jgi:hypothetical protein